ncbi:hypothetical protein EIP86_003139 [Pleurotus ostreatoroseus]|nr:hypothetical protein EIP86_003139 [Pleurotus ostreatoroseus]
MPAWQPLSTRLVHTATAAANLPSTSARFSDFVPDASPNLRPPTPARRPAAPTVSIARHDEGHDQRDCVRCSEAPLIPDRYRATNLAFRLPSQPDESIASLRGPQASQDATTASAVQALLDSLRASTALQQTLTANAANENTGSYGAASLAADTGHALNTPVSQPHRDDAGASSSGPPTTTTTPSASVAELLSQLKASSASSLGHSGVASAGSSHDRYEYTPDHRSSVSAQVAPSLPPALGQDLRSCSFQQALPYLTRLSEDPKFLEAARTLKREQEQLEKKLSEERQAIQRRHEEKVKVAKTKQVYRPASMIGAGLTQYEADVRAHCGSASSPLAYRFCLQTMTDGFRRDLQKFDTERALPAWDGLIAKQQTTLESLGVPAMFLTTEPADREVGCFARSSAHARTDERRTYQRQQRVMQVLDNFLV